MGTDREELGIVDLEARKIGHYNSENKQESHWYSLRGPRAGVGSDVATREIGAIEERGMEEGSYLIEYIKIEKSQKLSDYQTNKMILFLSKIKFYWNSQ